MMKIYFGENRLILSGKVREIQEKLKDCTKDYHLLSELVYDQKKCTPSFIRRYLPQSPTPDMSS